MKIYNFASDTNWQAERKISNLIGVEPLLKAVTWID
jgi:hypothetical protein